VDRASFRTAVWQNPAVEWRLFGYGVVINRGVVAGTQQSARPGAWRNFVLILPYWLLALVFAVPPATFIVRRARSARQRETSLCPTCGYDLRATPDRCPECGTAKA
jgi:hypothetical protein